MICSNCNFRNDAETVFCVNCGKPIAVGTQSTVPTENFQGGFAPQDSTVTAVVNAGPPMVNYATQPASIGYPAKKTNPVIWIGIGGLLLVALIAAVLFIIMPRINGEILPDHLGMFITSGDKGKLSEVRGQDTASLIEARNSIIKDDSLAMADPQPGMILYADGKEVPVSDLRLLQVDTIKDDGTMKQLDFQAAPVDGKPEMKRLRPLGELANGKYAFALIDGYFDDGKHKVWAFQVKNSSKNDNGDALRSTSASLKPKPTPPPAAPKTAPAMTQNVAPPSAGNTATCISSNVILRSGPSQSYPKMRNLAYGEKVYILSYSSNTESFRGRSSPFAQVRTASGDVGWVYSSFLR